MEWQLRMAVYVCSTGKQLMACVQDFLKFKYEAL